MIVLQKLLTESTAVFRTDLSILPTGLLIVAPVTRRSNLDQYHRFDR